MASIAARAVGSSHGVSVSRSWLAGSKSTLERDVPVLALRPWLALRQRRLERVDQHRARAAGLDHLVDVAALGGGVRGGEPVFVVRDQLPSARPGVVGLL